MHALIDLRAAVGLAGDTAMKSVGLASEWEITEAARADFGANILPDILSVPERFMETLLCGLRDRDHW